MTNLAQGGGTHVGRVLDGRWLLDRLLREGGMGAVYRARDLETGSAVAVKLMLELDPKVTSRFEREVHALARLQDPRIVRYVGHGTSERPYLVMEWLQGEDLAARLARAPLGTEDTVALARAIAGALAAAHRERLVHRDIKPANIFLVEGDPARAKLLDFGLVSTSHGPCTSLSRDVLLGTPAYMSPEQARGMQSTSLDAASDVFSLGVVLYKCMTGRAPFTGENMFALALNITLEEAPRVSTSKPDVPRAFDELIAQMLAKDPAARPRDGSELLGRLAAMDVPSKTLRAHPPAEWLMAEQRLVSVVLAGAREPLGPGALARAMEIARAHGVRLDSFSNRRIVATADVHGSATDQAARAAHTALALRGELALAPLAIATGRAVFRGLGPTGESIDRAVCLLGAAESTPAPAPAIRLDDVTAALLEGRFDVARGAGGAWLGEPRSPSGAGRTLLGKQSPFVGRAREMQILEATLAESSSSRAASAAERSAWRAKGWIFWLPWAAWRSAKFDCASFTRRPSRRTAKAKPLPARWTPAAPDCSPSPAGSPTRASAPPFSSASPRTRASCPLLG
ncbi:protein kinase domain-containing protein [Pendulispora albinea]|uniref:Serine/threonine protein kinase n=1 Tax=Pendulispora albinea TaxID=2741071 RepID=A0ABZ2LWQ2_9BACT